jgi:hypothetical protein
MVCRWGECGVFLPKHSSGAEGGAFWEGHPAIAHAADHMPQGTISVLSMPFIAWSSRLQ